MQQVFQQSLSVQYANLFEAFYRSLVKPEYFGKIMNYRYPDYAFCLFEGTPRDKDVVLDVGCACSYLIACLAKFTPRVFGIDLIDSYAKAFTVPWLETMEDFAEYRSGRINVIQQNAAELPFADSYFDLIYTVSALEHFTDEDELACVREVYRTLKPGGLFVGTVDYNEAAERPAGPESPVRAYTYEAFVRRIVEASGLRVTGVDCLREHTPAQSVGYLTVPLFFKLEKP